MFNSFTIYIKVRSNIRITRKLYLFWNPNCTSSGFKKDGNKVCLREQDIEKIVQTFIDKDEVEGYSCFIIYKEILEENEGNLNVPRYIQKIGNTLPQNIASHLKGGIPKVDINSLEKLWKISPQLKQKIFTCVDEGHNVYALAIDPNEIETTISEDEILKMKEKMNAEIC